MWLLFFKQKTAYEMRISDWSSDVCSSDLCLPVRVEGKGGAPFAIGGRETHLLHIGVFGPVERVHIWPTKEGAIVGKQLRDSEEFRLDVWLKDRKLRLEGIMQPNFPSHIASRLCCVNVRCGTSMPALRVSRRVKEFAEGCLTNPATSDEPIERCR